MKRLTATYRANLSNGFYIRRPDLPNYQVRVEIFDVGLSVVAAHESYKLPSDTDFIRCAKELSIACTRDENEPMPGGDDPDANFPYFRSRTREFRGIAESALTRFLEFLSHELNQPNFGAVDLSFNPEWIDEAGNEGAPFRIANVYGKGPDFGMIPIDATHDADISACMTNGYTSHLHQELLINAQVAACEGNVRRAVLELAITCEVAAKHKFFGVATPSALAFEHLEGKGALRVRVLDLIHKTSEAVYGESFRDHSEVDYRHIEEVFRCRNKIAHRGTPTYTDDQHGKHEATVETVDKWFNQYALC